MKKSLIFLLMTIPFFLLSAGDSFEFYAKSGDTEFDLALSEMNAKARLSWSSFSAELAVSHGISNEKLNDMRDNVKMEPADIYMALKISVVSGKPLDDVIKVYKSNKDKGWGFIAKEMGIKPGSAEFHKLKDQTKNRNMAMKEKKSGGSKKNKAKKKK